EEMQLDVLASAQAFEYILPSNEVVLSNSASFSIENTSVEVSGSYLISIFDGFCWSAQEEVAVQVDFIPNVFATVNDSILSCDGNSALLLSLNDPGISGEWTTSHAEVNIVSPNAVSSNVLGLEEGNVYQFEWSLFNAGCGIYSSTVQTVLVPEAPIALADVYEVVAGDPVDLEVQLNDPESEFAVSIYMLDVPNFGTWNVAGGDYVEYRPEIDFFGEDQFIYARCYDDCPQRCDTALVTIDVDPFLGIPDIITPNGDGVNDALRIEGLDRVPEHRLIIHNRWGSIIFEAENYQNDWEGTFNGERVSSGTYFFTFIDTARQKTMKQGYITIQ
ncbi:MAG: gliding motility-associated C-terminal domain-containing protein, partial [Flavobacteriales bacterium]|nr:gliding motility-associated C-terminal domain-containing protein [Flavobacteriales bacterium]